jgi:hypothetical protein
MGMDGTGAMGVICDTVWDKLRPQDPGRVNMEICRRIDWGVFVDLAEGEAVRAPIGNSLTLECFAGLAIYGLDCRLTSYVWVCMSGMIPRN